MSKNYATDFLLMSCSEARQGQTRPLRLLVIDVSVLVSISAPVLRLPHSLASSYLPPTCFPHRALHEGLQHHEVVLDVAMGALWRPRCVCLTRWLRAIHREHATRAACCMRTVHLAKNGRQGTAQE